jgi:hypothetical protein
MTSPDAPTRADRLAAKLRENLHRRKAQARALGEADAPQQVASGESADGLSKDGPSR